MVNIGGKSMCHFSGWPATRSFNRPGTPCVSAHLPRIKQLSARCPTIRNRAVPSEKWQEVAGFEVFFEHLSTAVQGRDWGVSAKQLIGGWCPPVWGIGLAGAHGRSFRSSICRISNDHPRETSPLLECALKPRTRGFFRDLLSCRSRRIRIGRPHSRLSFDETARRFDPQPPPTMRVEHDLKRCRLRIVGPTGPSAEFADPGAPGFLVMARDPRSGQPKPLLMRGEPVTYYLCPEVGSESWPVASENAENCRQRGGRR
jgi:hypothetical protein